MAGIDAQLSMCAFCQTASIGSRSEQHVRQMVPPDLLPINEQVLLTRSHKTFTSSLLAAKDSHYHSPTYFSHLQHWWLGSAIHRKMGASTGQSVDVGLISFGKCDGLCACRVSDGRNPEHSTFRVRERFIYSFYFYRDSRIPCTVTDCRYSTKCCFPVIA